MAVGTQKAYAGETNILAPMDDAVAVTPSNTVDLTNHAVRLYVGVTGSVKVDLVSGSTVTYATVPAGSYLNVRVKRVYATGTSATSIVAEF